MIKVKREEVRKKPLAATEARLMFRNPSPRFARTHEGATRLWDLIDAIEIGPSVHACGMAARCNVVP